MSQYRAGYYGRLEIASELVPVVRDQTCEARKNLIPCPYVFISMCVKLNLT